MKNKPLIIGMGVALTLVLGVLIYALNIISSQKEAMQHQQEQAVEKDSSIVQTVKKQLPKRDMTVAKFTLKTDERANPDKYIKLQYGFKTNFWNDYTIKGTASNNGKYFSYEKLFVKVHFLDKDGSDLGNVDKACELNSPLSPQQASSFTMTGHAPPYCTSVNIEITSAKPFQDFKGNDGSGDIDNTQAAGNSGDWQAGGNLGK